jgi:exosome complex component RRP42
MKRNNFKKKTLRELLMANNILKFIKENKRLDGRGFLDYRDIQIETNVIKKAYASARVELGDTVVIVGISFELGSPFSDSPDKGILLTEGEVLPTASFSAEAGPPSEEEIEISRVVDRSIRESEIVDLSKLTIIPGDTVLKMFVDFNIFNDDGNIIDAAVMGVVSALITGSMPDPKYISEHLDELSPHNLSPVPKIPIPVQDFPIANTLILIDDKILVDPSFAEEMVADAKITITHTVKDEICAVQLIHGGLGYEQVFEVLNISLDKSIEIRDKIRGLLNLGDE